MANRDNYNPIILGGVAGAATLGVVCNLLPIPGADVGPLLAQWSFMLQAIAQESGHKKNIAFWSKAASLIITGSAVMVTAIKVTIAILEYTGVGYAAGLAINSFINAFYTWRLGKAAVDLFDKPGISFDDVSLISKTLLNALMPMPTPKELKEFYAILKTVLS